MFSTYDRIEKQKIVRAFWFGKNVRVETENGSRMNVAESRCPEGLFADPESYQLVARFTSGKYPDLSIEEIK